MAYVENTIKASPIEANLGGDPSFQNKIRAFVDVKYKKHGAWTNPRLEVRSVLHGFIVPWLKSHRAQIINKTPVWARIYYLLRTGYPQKAWEIKN